MILGSAVEVIVLESARREGVEISCLEDAKVDAPETVVTLATA